MASNAIVVQKEKDQCLGGTIFGGFTSSLCDIHSESLKGAQYAHRKCDERALRAFAGFITVTSLLHSVESTAYAAGKIVLASGSLLTCRTQKCKEYASGAFQNMKTAGTGLYFSAKAAWRCARGVDALGIHVKEKRS